MRAEPIMERVQVTPTTARRGSRWSKQWLELVWGEEVVAASWARLEYMVVC